MNIASLAHDALARIHDEIALLETPAEAKQELDFLQAVDRLVVKKFPLYADFLSAIEAHLEAVISPAPPAAAPSPAKPAP